MDVPDRGGHSAAWSEAPSLALADPVLQRQGVLEGKRPVGEWDLDAGLVERALDGRDHLVAARADVDRARARPPRHLEVDRGRAEGLREDLHVVHVVAHRAERDHRVVDHGARRVHVLAVGHAHDDGDAPELEVGAHDDGVLEQGVVGHHHELPVGLPDAGVADGDGLDAALQRLALHEVPDLERLAQQDQDAGEEVLEGVLEREADRHRAQAQRGQRAARRDRGEHDRQRDQPAQEPGRGARDHLQHLDEVHSRSRPPPQARHHRAQHARGDPRRDDQRERDAEPWQGIHEPQPRGVGLLRQRQGDLVVLGHVPSPRPRGSARSAPAGEPPALGSVSPGQARRRAQGYTPLRDDGPFGASCHGRPQGTRRGGRWTRS